MWNTLSLYLNVLTNNHKVLTTWLNCSFLPVFHPSFALTFPTNNIYNFHILSLFVLLYFVYLRTFQEVSDVVHTCTHTRTKHARENNIQSSMSTCVSLSPLYISSHFPHILLCLACLSKLYGLCSIYTYIFMLVFVANATRKTKLDDKCIQMKFPSLFFLLMFTDILVLKIYFYHSKCISLLFWC